MMAIPYILVLLLLTTAHCQCPAYLYSTNLTTDLLQLSSPSPSYTLYSYVFKAPFQQVPRISIAITHLATRGQDALLNPFFYIYASNVTKGAMQIQTYFQNQKWTISKVTILSGHNSQLLLGSTTLQNSKQTSGSSNTRLSFQISINTTLPVNNNQISRGFINGFNSMGRFVNISLVNTSMSRGKISFNIDTVGENLVSIWVSFVVFNLNNGQFSAYGGYTVVNSNVSDTVDLLKGFSAVQNLFYGINTLHAQSNSLNISTDIDSNFLMKYSSSSGNFILTYLFIGYHSNLTCARCLGNSYQFDGMCVSQCSGNSILVSLANGGKMCRGCPIGTGLVAVNNACVCPSNTQFVNNRCVQTLTGLNVQLGQNLAIRPTSGEAGTVSWANNGVITVLSGQTINQNSNFVSPLPSQQASTTSMSFSTSSSQNIVSSSGIQILSPSSTQQTSSSTFLPPLLPTKTPIPTLPSGIILPAETQRIAGITSTTTNCQVPNSYFNGNQCVCIVSYVYQNGKCVLPQIPTYVVPSIYVPPSNQSQKTVKCQQNAQYNGNTCVCIQNYYFLNNVCIKCQANSQWNGFSCICNNNYYSLNGQCVLQRTNICPTNSVDNGLGICVCVLGFTMLNNQCIPVSNCPPNSTLVNNSCTCNRGFFNISGTCSQCPSGAFWSSASKKCIYVCGVNSFFNATLGNCSCIPSFGVGSSGICQQCTSSFYLSNGFCITCPVNSVYNQRVKGCFCSPGFILSEQGICVAKCMSNQRYNELTTACDCIANFTRVGSVCIPCDSNSYYINNQCFICPPNSSANNGKCICNTGFIANSFGNCVTCMSLPNTFLINGLCATCPNNQIYSNNTESCECPPGKTLQGNLCIQICGRDELLDSNGNCYSCGMNQVISNGLCACLPGYTSNGCGGCTLSCGRGYFAFMGQCAICPMNMNYFEQITGCVCPNGYYMDPLSNVCEKSNFILPLCSNGTFYDAVSEKCAACSSGCSSCSSLSTCQGCLAGFSLSNGVCRAVCGDGLIRGSQNCDGGSNIQAGCANCTIVTGYRCTGQPSVCSLVAPPPVPITPNNTVIPPLSLNGNVSINSNNVFITLKTNPTFRFPDPTQMKNFIQYTFYNGIRPTTYCMQRQTNLSLFDCLLIYPSGVPNSRFRILFFYSYQGIQGNTTVTVDPLQFLSTRK